MSNRAKLHEKFIEILGNNHVYYQPPSNLVMEYPAIRYNKSTIKVEHANNGIYSMKDCYELIVIDKRPDNPAIKKLMELPYCSYGRQYKADNLYHDTLTIYD